MSTELATKPILDFSMIRKQGKRQGPKGYDVYRFVGSAEVIDHQNEVVDIQDLLSIQEIMLKQGGRIQSFHSNHPAGEFFDYGLVTIKDKNGEDVLSIWLDVEVYDDYPSQKDMKGRLDLPKGHPKRINGLSLGGKSYQSKRRCDADRCWVHLGKLEGWEYSLVDEPACPLALRIDEYNDEMMSKLEINTTFSDIYEKEGLTVTQANEVLKSKIKKEKPRGEDGRFLQPDEDCPTGDCPEEDTTIIKMEEEEGKKKVEEKPTEAPPEEEGSTEGAPEEEAPPGEPSAEGEPIEAGGEEEKMEGEMSPEEGMADAYSATSSTDSIAEVSMKLDTIMSALNIGKGENGELDFSELTEAISNTKKERNEEPMVDYIEKDGKKYQLVEEETPQIIEKDGVKYQLVTEEPPVETEAKAEIPEVSKLEKNVASLTELVTKMSSQINKRSIGNSTPDPNKETEEVTDKVLGKQLIRKAVNSLKEDKAFEHLNAEELDWRVRSSFFKKNFGSMSLEEAGVILQ